MQGGSRVGGPARAGRRAAPPQPDGAGQGRLGSPWQGVACAQSTTVSSAERDASTGTIWTHQCCQLLAILLVLTLVCMALQKQEAKKATAPAPRIAAVARKAAESAPEASEAAPRAAAGQQRPASDEQKPVVSTRATASRQKPGEEDSVQVRSAHSSCTADTCCNGLLLYRHMLRAPGTCRYSELLAGVLQLSGHRHRS